ncbi:hypothetical protein pb186bvf_009857 [Paramecium bursaria]
MDYGVYKYLIKYYAKFKKISFSNNFYLKNFMFYHFSKQEFLIYQSQLRSINSIYKFEILLIKKNIIKIPRDYIQLIQQNSLRKNKIMKYYMRQHEEESQIIRAKTYEQKSQRMVQSYHSCISEGMDYSASTSSLQNSRLTGVDYQIPWQLDETVLSEEAKQKIILQPESLEDFKQQAVLVSEFLCEGQFKNLIDQAQDDMQIREIIILTLEHFTNIITLLLYLVWKSIQNETQQKEMVDYVTCREVTQKFVTDVLTYRVNQFRADCSLLTIIKNFQPLPQNLILECQKQFFPLRIFESNFKQWTPKDVGNTLSLINQNFYAELQVPSLNCLNNRDQQMKNYLLRVNSLSFYVIYSVVKHRDKVTRQEVITYWLEVATQLKENKDLEGLFIICKLGIDKLTEDYAKEMPLQFKQKDIKKHLLDFYEQNHDNTSLENWIPSFYTFWVSLKKLETTIKSDINALKIIKDKIKRLIEISKYQFNKQREDKKYLAINLQIQSFLLRGHQKELENHLQVEISKDVQVQVALLKLGKI